MSERGDALTGPVVNGSNGRLWELVQEMPRIQCAHGRELKHCQIVGSISLPSGLSTSN